MTKHKKPVREPDKVLDPHREKRERGRPRKIGRSEVFGRAKNYRWVIGQIWPRVREPLSTAATGQDVTAVFERHGEPYAQKFVPRLAEDILTVMHEPKFPKRTDAQITFLADSLAGRPNVEPRTSRDICTKERAKERAKSPNRILRKEFYVECSCGYKGPARNDACRNCGAQISYLAEMLLGPRFG